jgi:hypothetical protein
VNSPNPIDETINKAFQLAYFIDGDKENATRIVSRAMAKLTVAATAQDKRLYYKPVGRSFLQEQKSNRLRNKVTFSEPHLLQRLIYIESEWYEKQKEQMSGTVAEEDMIIHFIKHLVRITLKRNSFYVALGISRLLHNYTTAETMGIYSVVIQDPERVKDDYYYRSRKGILMQEIKDRFGDFLRVSHGQRGEERFQSEPNPGRFVTLVRECLLSFTPWATLCVIPENLDPLMTSVPSLLYRNESTEDEAELNRIHAVLHPECYKRLTTALGFPAPEERLELPHFHFSNQGRNGGETMRNPTVSLSEEELRAIKNDLDDLAERRRNAAAGILEFRVDGRKYARLDLKKERHVRLALNAGNELIEISTEDSKGDLLLASHLLTFDERVETGTTKSTIVLEGGQKLSIDISHLSDSSGPVVDITYRGSNQFKAIPPVLERLLARTNIFPSSFVRRPLFQSRRARILIPVTALIFLLVIGAVIAKYVNRQDSQPKANVAQSSTTEPDSQRTKDGPEAQRKETDITQQKDQSSSPQVMSAPQSSRSTRQENAPSPTGDTTRQPLSVDTASNAGEEATRSVKRAEPRVSLQDVRSIFVEIKTDEPSAQALHDVLVERLRISGRLTLSKGRDEADALLKVTMTRATGGASESAAPTFAIQLINPQGQVLWPVNGGSRAYSGLSVQQVGVRIVQDLLAVINQNGRRP